MAVIREGGTDPGSQRGRKGGTKGMQLLILLIQFMICMIWENSGLCHCCTCSFCPTLVVPCQHNWQGQDSIKWQRGYWSWELQ